MYLVFDIGGTFVKYGVLDENGKIEAKGKVPTITEDREGFLKSIAEIYESVREYGIEGIALSVPGLIDSKNGVLNSGGALHCMYGRNIAQEISLSCDQLRVSVENDGKCVGLAEAWMGAAKGEKTSCTLVFGTGVGGSVVINNRVHHGTHLIAGELSYLIAPKDYKDISVSRFGTDYSTRGIVNKAKEAYQDEEMTGEKLFELYHEHDTKAVEILEDFFFNVACQCYNIQYLIDPGVICIGGGISQQSAVVDGIDRYIQKIYMNTRQFRMPKILPCKFLSDSNMIGALYVFKKQYEIA